MSERPREPGGNGGRKGAGRSGSPRGSGSSRDERRVPRPGPRAERPDRTPRRSQPAPRPRPEAEGAGAKGAGAKTGDAKRGGTKGANAQRPNAQSPNAKRAGNAQGTSRSRPAAGPGARSGKRPSVPAQGGRLRLARARPRLRLVAFGLTLVMLIFGVRLLQVQAVDAGTYAQKAAVNRYITVPLSADRGTISSRDGTALATTVDAYDITADPYLFTPKQTRTHDAPERAAALLAPLLHQDEQELARKLSERHTRYVLLARQQPPRVWEKLNKLRSKGEAAELLGGIYREKHAKRVYPNKQLASNVLGFVNARGQGGAGVEAKLDKQLAGRDGKTTYAQSGGRRVPTAGGHERPARPGSDVELTIDRDIQWAAQQAISQQIKKSHADSGYVVVQDPRSGQLLAMADAPDFDPNDIAHADPHGLGNAAVQDAYEPGSTSKLMSMAAVLQEGKATPRTEVTVPNRLKRADRSFADDADHPTLHLTLNGVLARSSNLGTILATEQLGDTRKKANAVLYRYLRKFGIGRPTGLDLPGETAGILQKPGEWSASQQYTIPFGQGLSLNAVQAASIYSTIANGGVRTTPSLVRGTTGPGGGYTPSPAAHKRRVVGKKTAKTLTRMLESVVSDMEGTGTTAKIPGYRVAGKTGTANRVDPKTGRYEGYTSSFVGFAPADKPRVTVYCAVQNPKKGSYFGSDVCGPVYKQVMKFALKTLQVPPTGAKPHPLPVDAGSGKAGDAHSGSPNGRTGDHG